MNAMRNKSISKHVRYKLEVFDKTKICPIQVKDVPLPPYNETLQRI